MMPFMLPPEPDCFVCGFPASATKLIKVLGGQVCADSAACVIRVVEAEKTITDYGTTADIPRHDQALPR